VKEVEKRELGAKGAKGVNAAAEFLGISRAFLYELMGDGRLKYVKLGTRRLIPVVELERLIAARVTSS
jgi:excisionase family DNA binding protein